MFKTIEIEKEIIKIHGDFNNFEKTQKDFGKEYPQFCVGFYHNLCEHIFQKDCIETIAEAIETTKFSIQNADFEKPTFENIKDYAYLHFLYALCAYFAALIFKSNIYQKETFEFFAFEILPLYFDFLIKNGVDDYKSRLFLTLARGYFEQQIELWQNEPPQIVKYGDKMFVFDFEQNETGRKIKADLKKKRQKCKN